MIEALLAILCGLLLMAELFSGAPQRWIAALRPWQTVLGVVALVAGVLHITSLIGIGLILGGLVLAANAMTSVPEVGHELKNWGRYLARFGVAIGAALIVLGLLKLLS